MVQSRTLKIEYISIDKFHIKCKLLKPERIGRELYKRYQRRVLYYKFYVNLSGNKYNITGYAKIRDMD